MGPHDETFSEIMIFAILTADSAFLFPRMWYGDDLCTMKPYS